MNNFTPGNWTVGRSEYNGQECIVGDGDSVVALMPDATMGCSFNADDARLMAAAKLMLREMKRYLPMLEMLESDRDVWQNATDGLGIATLNGYRYAIEKATGERP